MNVLIIEDEPFGVDRLRQLLHEADDSIRVVGVTDSIESSVLWLKSNPGPDVIMMDIELSDGQSFSIFDQVKVENPVIFTTSYDEYAIRAFKVNSIDYLLKPIKLEDLQTALAKLKAFSNCLPPRPFVNIEQLIKQLRQPSIEYRDRFLVKSGQRYFSVSVDDIAYFFYQNRVTFLKTWKKDMYFIDYVLDDLQEMLSPKTFFRANRQVLVNIKSVKDVHVDFNNKLRLTLTPVHDDEVLVSRERASEFKEWMGK